MQKIVLLISLSLLCLCSGIKAQETLIKVNLLSPLVRTGSFFVEHKINDNSSVQLGLFYTGKTWDDTKVRGWGITPEYRFYLSDSPAPEGFFVAPYLRYFNFDLEEKFDNNEAKLNSIGGGLIVGQQYIFKKRVSFEWFIGPSYSNIDLDVKTGKTDDFDTDTWEGFSLRAGITLGLAF